jgi:hypothetical protein
VCAASAVVFYRGTASGYFYGSLGKKKEAKTA